METRQKEIIIMVFVDKEMCTIITYGLHNSVREGHALRRTYCVGGE